MGVWRVDPTTGWMPGTAENVRVHAMPGNECNLLPAITKLTTWSQFRDTTSKEGTIMNRMVLAASTLSAAVGLALALSPIASADPVKDNTAKAMKEHLEKCYGINATGKNDCAAGAHSCAGQSTQARDPKSFVLVPAGDCAKIAGGTTSAM